MGPLRLLILVVGGVPWWVIDARRNYSGACVRWRPLVVSLHRFFLPLPGLLSIMMVWLVLALDPMV